MLSAGLTSLGDTGLETPSVTNEKTNQLRQPSAEGAAECAALRDNKPIAATNPAETGQHDTNLDRLNDVWPRIPESIRQRILGLIDAVELIAATAESRSGSDERQSNA